MSLVSEAYTLAPGTTTVRGGKNAVDVEAPSWGAALLQITSITQTGYNFSASLPATDALGVTVYLYQIGAGPLTVITGNAPNGVITGRTPGSTETLSLYARDAAGNTSLPISASVTLQAAAGPLSAQMLRADAIHTWFTQPEAIEVGGFVYAGWTNKTGGIGASRINLANPDDKKHFLLATLPEIDDHNNASVLALAGGKFAFFYGTHNDSEFKYRVWDGVGAFDSSTSWTAQANRGGSQGPYSYPKPFIFAQQPGKHWLFHRRFTDGGGATRTLTFRTTDSLTGNSDPWSAYSDVLREAGARPYVKMVSDGFNTVHVAASSAHPNESTFVSIHHFYGRLDGGNIMRWYTSADVEITGGLPFNIAATTRVDGGSSVKRWVSDVAIGGDGRPRILYMVYPNNNGSAIELWHARWNGTTWVNTKISDDGAGLYPAEQYYHGGLVFDGVNASRIYLSAPIAGVRQVQEWRTADGDTFTQHRVITSGGAAGNPLRLRPVSPRNHTGRLSVLWCEGRYTTYIDFDTALHGAG